MGEHVDLAEFGKIVGRRQRPADVVKLVPAHSTPRCYDAVDGAVVTSWQPSPDRGRRRPKLDQSVPRTRRTAAVIIVRDDDKLGNTTFAASIPPMLTRLLTLRHLGIFEPRTETTLG